MTESYTTREGMGEVIPVLTFVAYRHPAEVKLNIVKPSLQIRRHGLRAVIQQVNRVSSTRHQITEPHFPVMLCSLFALK